MSGTTRRRHATRGYFARLVAVVAGLAGLVLAHGLQCNDGMTVTQAAPSMSMAAGTAQGCAAPAAMVTVNGLFPEHVPPADTGHRLADTCAAAGAVGAFAMAGDGSSGSRGLGGVLATCLVVVVAVVAALVGLRSAGLRSVVRTPHSARVAAIRTAQPRAPSLAELCLLRT